MCYKKLDKRFNVVNSKKDQKQGEGFMFQERYKHLNKYLKDKFGERTLKICIDGGFTCPNRDGKCGTGRLYILQ